MNHHRITVTQTLPDGTVLHVPLDVLARTPDAALAIVFSWYNERPPTYLRPH